MSLYAIVMPDTFVLNLAYGDSYKMYLVTIVTVEILGLSNFRKLKTQKIIS